MINRELIPIEVNFYDGIDAYGQQLANLSETKTIEGAFGIISQNNTNDIRYLESTHYVLTKDRTITDKCELTIDGKVYKVKYVNPHRQWVQVFLCQM